MKSLSALILILLFQNTVGQSVSTPTNFPSVASTDSPVSEPSHRPINNPTRKPVPNPTAHPTHHPIPDPTHKPHFTHHPISEPTHKPTNSPTAVCSHKKQSCPAQLKYYNSTGNWCCEGLTCVSYTYYALCEDLRPPYDMKTPYDKFNPSDVLQRSVLPLVGGLVFLACALVVVRSFISRRSTYGHYNSVEGNDLEATTELTNNPNTPNSLNMIDIVSNYQGYERL